MNDYAARKSADEIVLAGERAFDLAGSHVRPAALEVEHEGAVAALEPRVMQVLVALHRGRGEPVSRDALIDLCWDGRVVTEGAVNRCVAQLRKALGPNARIRVETIPKVGYRLRALESAREPASALKSAPHAVASDSAARVDAAATPRDQVPHSDAPRAAPSSQWPLIAGAMLAVAILLAIVWGLTLPRPVTWTAAKYRPITTEAGLETYPALSPNGEQIVYAVRPDPYSPSDLYLRNVDQGTPLRLTSYEGDDYGASWSPNGDRIAFTRTPPQGPCSIVVVPIPRGAERVVTHCRGVTQTHASWLDSHTLVIADQPSASELPRIRTVDVQTGDTRDLTSPPRSTLGDAEPVVSPDGRYIVFRRTLVLGADDLFVLDVTTGRERALTEDGWKAAGYVWSSDSRHVFFSSNRGGEFGLWSADLRIDEPPRQVSLGLGAISFSRMSADRRNRLAVEIIRGRTNLARVSLSGAIDAVTTGTGSDWDAAETTDGTIAYISNRSGSYQVWIAPPEGDPVRLTSALLSYVTGPAWSPDGQTLAFVAVKGHRAELYTVARDGSQMHQITHDRVDKKDPVYAMSGDRIFYVTRAGGEWQLMQIGLAPGSQPQAVPGGQGWRVLRSDGAGNLYGQRGTKILTLDPAAPLVDVGLTDVDVWAVGTQGLYVRRGRAPLHPSSIWFHPWNGPARKLADTPLASSSIAVDQHGAVIFSQSPDYQVDLGLIELRR